MLRQTIREKKTEQANWSKWKSLAIPMLASLAIGCSGNSQPPDGCYTVAASDAGPATCYCTNDGVAIEGTLTSQGCVEGTPAACSSACHPATVIGLLNPDNPADNTLTSGGVSVRLDFTGQSGQSQVATIDVLICGQLIGSSSIPSGGSDDFSSGSTRITVNVGQVSSNGLRSAEVQAAITCQ